MQCYFNLTFLFLLLFFLGIQAPAKAQESPNCTRVVVDNQLTGNVFFNYGSTSDAFNTNVRSSVTIGQPSVGSNFGSEYFVGYGFWTRLLTTPSAPIVKATEGELDDRIQVNWSLDPLSPSATQGFKIYRDGALLAVVDNETSSYIDFNVIAGIFYTYEVTGLGTFGEGQKGNTLGFLNPNGVVTGQIKSFSGNPVSNAIVTLTPSLGTAIEFGGQNEMAFVEYDTSFSQNQFTLSSWVKLNNGNDNTGIFDMGSAVEKNWWLHTLPTLEGEGIRFGIGANNNVVELDYVFPDDTESEWHFMAATYNGSNLLLYVDGRLVGTDRASFEMDSFPLFFGQNTRDTTFYSGKLDEVRLYNRQLSQTEIQQFMNRSISKNTEGLISYWKFDEGIGNKAFDQKNANTTVYFCGSAWTEDRPMVVNSGITDETGFYEIAGVNYSGGATFTATPEKAFYFNQSLEFNAVNGEYASLSNFELVDTSTITITFKTFDFSPIRKTIFEKANPAVSQTLRLIQEGDELRLNLGSRNAPYHTFGTVDTGFHHLAVRLLPNGSQTSVELILNGTSMGSHLFNANPNLTDGPWTLGARTDGPLFYEEYYTGLIDELAYFDKILSDSILQIFSASGTDDSHSNLYAYFNLNEGIGTTIRDMGFGLSGSGTIYGAQWSRVAKIQEILPHEFLPASRLVSLNPSNTSADGIDFTDQSTIPVTGYVRYENTNCFKKGVEILVNGFSHSPRIITDSEGKFVADFEPGASIILTPVFEDHEFGPDTWELNNLTAPVAGILFRDLTKRSIDVEVVGGLCKSSIIPSGAQAIIKVSTLSGCFEKEITLDGPHDGSFTFENLPPDSLVVAVTGGTGDFSTIFDYFNNQGGVTLDLKLNDTATSFVYFADPQIEISALDTNDCGDEMLRSLVPYSVDVKVFENYFGDICYVDTALLTFSNNIADLDQFDTLMTAGSFKHKFKAGGPNLTPPYTKGLQVVANVNNRIASKVLSAVVLGNQATETDFASTAPEIPTLILRDPPGDGSYAFIEKDNKLCFTETYTASLDVGAGVAVELSLGADLTTSIGLGAAVETEIDATADFTLSRSSMFNNLVSNSQETCQTITETISTGDNDVIVGSAMGGDLYFGSAINYIFGGLNELKLDTNDANCGYIIDKQIRIFPEGIASTFIYTEQDILTEVIPDLEQNLLDTASANRWRDIVAQNEAQKAAAIFSENISFSAGIVYERTETVERTESISTEWGITLTTEMITALGLEINGVGVGTELKMNLSTSISESQTNDAFRSRTVGYVLEDDDIGDLFSVDVKRDPVYGTPVFDLLAGQSQCPHEPNTLFREKVSLSIDKNVATNVGMNDEAVFTLTLGNESESEELKVYSLVVFQENNPDGAVIRLNSQDQALNLEVPAGGSLDVIMTVERGPVEFEYTNLNVTLLSECEYNRAIFLDEVPAEQFAETILFDVFFLEPCSPVDLASPMEGWVQDIPAGDLRNITLFEYDETDPDLELIRVQYRRQQGDGVWINIEEIDKASLGPVSTSINWNTQGLQDGLYEIRAITQCTGGLNPGVSHVIGGIIERTAPEIFGVPEPADGILSAGDEISITFNEPIRCDLLIQADFFNNNNVGLYDTETGEIIDAIVTCSEDKIVIVPNIPSQFYENKVLRVEIDSIFDLVGNRFDHAEWEFIADQNPLRWQKSDLTDFKYEDEFKVIQIQIDNVGGTTQQYNITGIPDWVEVFPIEGNLAPGQQQLITFQFDSTLVVGTFMDTIIMEGIMGDEPLPIDFRVLCRPPLWQINPSDFSASMNFTVELDIEGSLSDDRQDIVSAFINGELRGLSYVEYVLVADKHEAFLTVYTNGEVGDTIKFQIWDASECLLYGEIIERFPFVTDGQEGAPLTPLTLHTNSLLQADIPIKKGWNWLSFNLDFPDNSLNEGLASLSHPQNDLIKNQVSFAEYVAQIGWIGSLTQLNNTSMFQYKADTIDQLRLIGNVIDPSAVSINLDTGWNWIGYLPLRALPINEALSSISAIDGDIIKSQTEFAQYVPGAGWIGNLEFLSAPNGYLIFLQNGGMLDYPANNMVGGNPPLRLNQLITKRSGEWEVNAADFEHTMTLVGMLEENGSNATMENQTLGAFVNNELRGVSHSIYIPALDQRLYFMTIYANKNEELVQFKIYDELSSEIEELNEEIVFEGNAQEGKVESPYPFTIDKISTGVSDEVEESILIVRPNPIRNHANIRYFLSGNNAHMIINNAQGQVVDRVDFGRETGWHDYQWDASAVPRGIYFIHLNADDKHVVRKVVVQ